MTTAGVKHVIMAVSRHNQELEQDSVAMHEEQRKLEREARSLALRLDAVLKDKFTARTSFDADTPIDKTLKFLQEVIAVSICSCECGSAFWMCKLLNCFDAIAAKRSSTAQHSTAQHSTAQHSTAQHTSACHNMHSRQIMTWYHEYTVLSTAWQKHSTSSTAQHSIAQE